MSNIPVPAAILSIPHLHAPQKMVLDWMVRRGLKRAVLDIGCGQTGLAAGMSNLCSIPVHVLDGLLEATQGQVTRFRQIGGQLGSSYVRDISKDPLPRGPWDVITCFHCHQHLAEEAMSKHFLSEVRKSLAPGGSFILADRVSEKGETYWWPRVGDPMWVRTVADLKKLLLDCGLTIKTMEGFVYEFNTDIRKETARWTSIDEAIIAIVEVT